MKAWMVTCDFSNVAEIVFAETANKARHRCAHRDQFSDIDYQDLRAHRAKQFDGRETNPPTNEELVVAHEWHFECVCGRAIYREDSPRWKDDQVVDCDKCREGEA